MLKLEEEHKITSKRHEIAGWGLFWQRFVEEEGWRMDSVWRTYHKEL